VQNEKRNITEDHEDVKFLKKSLSKGSIWQASRDKKEEETKEGREILGR
jgi:hypothetical protein